ncbi:MAG TPA: hypothetical protein VK338_04860 [Candidatus Nitrosocosmicus sp.]|nr:hypothetical protein [Candidatus Nitrosocosmicus sp.]
MKFAFNLEEKILLNRKTRIFVLLCVLLCLTFFLGKDLNIFRNQMFEFHDISQGARVQQFALNLETLHIPPRMAPDFSFGLGMPVFNYYAPTSYWITSFLHIIGFNIINALKLSFLLAILGSFISSFLFLKQFFKYYESLFGAVVYSTSLYIAVDIFVRGNLAETWFITLFPLALYTIFKTAKTYDKRYFALNILVLTLLFSVHNILSLFSIPILLVYVILLDNKKLNIIAFILSILLSAYYFLPLFLESNLVYAQEIAKQTDYRLHFLCPFQLWNSPWGYGGSIEGCTSDGLSFKLGRPQAMLLLGGLSLFILNFIKDKKKNLYKIGLFLLIVTMSSFFLTTNVSSFLWSIFEPFLAIVQFPWRFISFSLIGIAYMSSYFISTVNIPYKSVIILMGVSGILFINSKYFHGQLIQNDVFEQKYLSDEFIQKNAAYKVPEYLPKDADYSYWKNLENKNTSELKYKSATIMNDNSFNKTIKPSSNEVILPIHYFPNWQILVNDKVYYPNRLDALGRPILVGLNNQKIHINFHQTSTEKLGNTITIFTFILIIYLIAIHKRLWNHQRKK